MGDISFFETHIEKIKFQLIRKLLVNEFFTKENNYLFI